MAAAEHTPIQHTSGPLEPGRLTQIILALAGAELPRVEFFRQLCMNLARAVRSQAVELWLTDHDAWFRLGWSPATGFEAARLETLADADIAELCRAAGLVPEGWDHDVLTVSPVGDQETSITVLPLEAGGQRAGWLSFPSPEPSYLVRREADGFLRVSETLAIALEHQRLLAALRERVKELTCTHGLSSLAEGTAPLDEQLADAIDLIPPALQFPEVAQARVVLDGTLIGHTESSPSARLTAPLWVNGQERGEVEVLYIEDTPRVGDDPFLAEERELLATVARQLSSLVERHEAREEKRRLESKLRHADRLATIGTLAAGVAHELNEPLGAVLGFAQLAAGSGELPDRVASDLAKIEEAALHARSIVRQLMLFARRDLPKTQPTELDRVVQGALSLVRARCKKAGVEVIDGCAAEGVCIDADPPRLQQVVVNLLVNAVQAMPDGGTLTVMTRGEAGNAVLEVRDTGLGMDAATREQIFVPFYTTKEVNVGTGLGLAVVHGIVTAHGGSIRVDSDLGRGTVFEVQIPRCGCAVEHTGGER